MPATPPHHRTRREFLRQTAAGGVLLGSVPAALAATRVAPGLPGRTARNVIFMVADGMSIGTLTLADMYIRSRHHRPSHWVQLWSRQGVRRAQCATFAADSLVTDSAAAATAYSIGERVNNGAICITPDGREPSPIIVRAKQRGLATGLVTTTRLTHATPAAFIANVRSRNEERQIALQILDRRLDVAMGGGSVHFPSAELQKHQDLSIIRTRDELLALGRRAGGRVLGLFATDHMSYEIDRPDHEPSLAEMTGTALAMLDQRNTGFLVQIEGGRIDHAAHNNDIGTLIRDQLAFDDALAVAVEFAAARDDTLLIVTTDHGNANPAFTIYGAEGIRRFERIAGCRYSFEWLRKQSRVVEEGDAAERLKTLIGEATGITLTPVEFDFVNRVVAGERIHPFTTANSFYPVLGAVLANHFGVAFASPNHTSDLVEVAALGPGSERLAPMIDNTDLHTIMAAMLDLPTPQND
jgi:alkaline phosphatase